MHVEPFLVPSHIYICRYHKRQCKQIQSKLLALVVSRRCSNLLIPLMASLAYTWFIPSFTHLAFSCIRNVCECIYIWSNCVYVYVCVSVNTSALPPLRFNQGATQLRSLLPSFVLRKIDSENGI